MGRNKGKSGNETGSIKVELDWERGNYGFRRKKQIVWRGEGDDRKQSVKRKSCDGPRE